MGYTKEQLAFLEKYEEQLKELIEEDLASKRREKNEKKIKHLSFIVASGFMALALFLYSLFKCKFVFVEFNIKYFVVEISFELAIWGIAFIFTDIILRKTKYKIYGYFISIAISFILSYVFIGLVDFKLSDEIKISSIITASISLLIFICCFLHGLFRGARIGKAKNSELYEMEQEYYSLFVTPRYYNNKPSVNTIKKNSRKKNRKRKK